MLSQGRTQCECFVFLCEHENAQVWILCKRGSDETFFCFLDPTGSSFFHLLLLPVASDLMLPPSVWGFSCSLCVLDASC